MLKMYAMLIAVFTATQSLSAYTLKAVNSNVPADVEWAVVGAGPAGIVVVGLLLDLGIDPQQIAWIDPEFNVGRLSQYPEVPANSTMQSFIDFLLACKTFTAIQSPNIAALANYDPNKEYPLATLIAPLRDISLALCARVRPIKGALKSLDFRDDVWQVAVEQTSLTARRIVLATGSYPRSLNYAPGKELSLECALNKSHLEQVVGPQDTVAVVGSAHSAVLIMKSLSELPVARIINLYHKPLCYAVDMGGWVMNAAFGLRGIAAEWAKTVLEKNPPANLVRFFNSEAVRKAWLPICTKIVYAIGFDRNQVPTINGSQQDISYDTSTGFIAPHLFGIGIAFPEHYIDPMGNPEYRVGLNSFMAYAQRVMPEWMNKDIQNRYKSFEKFFTINIL